MCSARSWRCCCKSASTIWQTPPAPPSNGRRYCAISTACSSCACATAAPTGWFAPTPHPPLPRCSATPRSPYRRVSSRSRRRPRHRRQNPPQNPAAARDVVPRPPEFRQNPRDISCLAKQGVQVGSNGCCQDLRPFQPLSCRHGIVDPVISPKQDGFLEDEGGHLPDFSVGTRTEPLSEGTRRRLSRGGAGGTDAEIGMQTTAEPFERLFRAFQGQHGLRFRHRRRNLFEKLHRPALRGELRLAPGFVIFGRNDTANGFDNDEPGALLLDPGSIRCAGKAGDERREKLVAHPVHHEIVEVNGIFGQRTGKAVRKARDIPDLAVLETGDNHRGLVYADISVLVWLLV